MIKISNRISHSQEHLHIRTEGVRVLLMQNPAHRTLTPCHEYWIATGHWQVEAISATVPLALALLEAHTARHQGPCSTTTPATDDTINDKLFEHACQCTAAESQLPLHTATA